MIGRKLHQYLVEEKLGEGGMGVVWKARDTRLDRQVALKVLRTGQVAGPEQLERFVREAKSASALNHPNIVTIYEIDRDRDVDFIAMEYVRGETLSERLRRAPLPVDEAVRFASQIAGALACAHAAGIIHRDLKPGNIMISETGSVKVLDFGLAKKLAIDSRSDSDSTADTVTRAGATVGTPAYMSPEQTLGATVDVRSDVFSFGVVLYEMLSGSNPFKRNTQSDTFYSLHFSDPPPIQRAVPSELDAIMTKAIRKKPEDRFRDMTEVRAALQEVENASFTVRMTGALAGRRLWRSSVAASRSPGVWLAVLLLTGLAAAALPGWIAGPEPAERVVPPAAEAPTEPTPRGLSAEAEVLIARRDREGNIDRAISLLEKALELDRKHATGYALLAEAYRWKYREKPDRQWLQLATDAATQAVSLNSDLAIAHVARAFVALTDGRGGDASRGFQRAIQLDPASARAHLGMAMAHASARGGDEAEREFQTAARLNPKDWNIPGEWGTYLYRRSRYAEAVAAWEKAREAAPDNAVIFRNLAAAYHQLGRYDDAAASLQRALEIQPSAPTYTNLGTTRFFQGRYSEAVPAFEKAVELSASNSLYWGNLADAYRWAPGRRGDSVPAYGRAIGLIRAEIPAKPRDADLLTRLAVYLAKAGNRAEAMQTMKLVGAASTLQPQALIRLAVVYEIAGKRDLALDAIQRALKGGYPLNEISNEPEFLSLRTDLRFQRLLAQRNQ